MQEMMKRLMSPTAGDGDGDVAAGAAAAASASTSAGDIDARWRLADAEAEQEDLRDRVQALTRENEELRERELSVSATAVASAREDETARTAHLASLERELAAAKRERDDAIGERGVAVPLARGRGALPRSHHTHAHTRAHGACRYVLQKKLEAKEEERQAAPASNSEDFTALQQELITTKASARSARRGASASPHTPRRFPRAALARRVHRGARPLSPGQEGAGGSARAAQTPGRIPRLRAGQCLALTTSARSTSRVCSARPLACGRGRQRGGARPPQAGRPAPQRTTARATDA